MANGQYIDFQGIWVCETRHSEQYAAIRVKISETHIHVVYTLKTGQRHTEEFDYKLLSQSDGWVTVAGAPFTFLQFVTTNKLIISRLDFGDRKSFSYVFSLYEEKVKLPHGKSPGRVAG